MNLFYHAQSRVGESIELDPADAVHLHKVLRMQQGSLVHVTNGQGELFEGEVSITGKSVSVANLRLIRKEDSVPQLELAIAPTKNQDRLEWFVEKAVEIGIGKIRLISAAHSERTHTRMDRLHRVAVSAMKQSLKLHLPFIYEPIDFKTWIKEAGNQVYIAHCREIPTRRLLRDALIPGQPASIAIGPEGDFAVSELQMAADAGCIAVSLGKSRLRTETAALCAVHTFELINQK